MDTYEQKYNEALERAKKLHKDAITLQLEQDIKDYEYIFPELAESEDERIRKEFCEDIWTFIPNEKAHKYIAWLEKQGDKDKLIKELGEYKVKYIQEVLSQQLEKQAKKKSQRMISAEAKEALYGKPAWSEEDDWMKTKIIKVLLGSKTFLTSKETNECIDWLQSLKSQSHWKPTKEQMYMLEWLTTNVLDDGVVGKKAKEVLNTLIEQLKSL